MSDIEFRPQTNDVLLWEAVPEATPIDLADDNTIIGIANWSEERQRKGEEGAKQYHGARNTLRYAMSMLAIEIYEDPDRDWAAEAERLKRTEIQSNLPFMPAVNATFGVYNADLTDLDDLRKFLDRMANALELIVDRVEQDADGLFPMTKAGAKNLAGWVKEQGGITALANAGRASRKGSTIERTVKAPDGQIQLDRSRHREIRKRQADEYLLGTVSGNTIAVALVALGGRSDKILLTLDLDEEEVDRLRDKARVVDPLVDRMGQLFQAGNMVVEAPSDELKDKDGDTRPAQAEYRTGYRQFVFGPDGSITISRLLAEAGVAVEARALGDFLPALNEMGCLRTRERRIVETNIKDVSRRTAFLARWGDVGGTQGLARFEVRTEATEDGSAQTRSVLISPLQSEAGNLPLQVDAVALKPSFEGEIKVEQLRAFALNEGRVSLTAKSKAEVTLAFSPDRCVFDFGTKEAKVDLKGEGSAKAGFQKMDLRAVVDTICALPVAGSIRVRVDAETGICLEFQTNLFEFRVYVPTRLKDGGRNNRLFRAFAI